MKKDDRVRGGSEWVKRWRQLDRRVKESIIRGKISGEEIVRKVR
jgi:hypothetical protein